MQGKKIMKTNYPKLNSETKKMLRRIVNALMELPVMPVDKQFQDDIIDFLDWYKDSPYSGGIDDLDD